MTRHECRVHGEDCYSCVFETTIEDDDMEGVTGFCDTCDLDREATAQGTCDVCGKALRFYNDPRDEHSYWAEG